MEKTKLFFFVTGLGDVWVIRSEGEFYGPFASYRAAYDQAVVEARAATTYGFASAVFVPSSAGGSFKAGWAFGRDAPVLVTSTAPN
jgi:hypothetical protein